MINKFVFEKLRTDLSTASFNNEFKKIEYIDYWLFYRYDKDLGFIIGIFKSSIKCYIMLQYMKRI